MLEFCATCTKNFLPRKERNYEEKFIFNYFTHPLAYYDRRCFCLLYRWKQRQ